MDYVILQKSRVKSHIRSRKGKLERVKEHERKEAYTSGLKEGDKVVDSDGYKGKIISIDPENERNFIVMYTHDRDSWSVNPSHLKRESIKGHSGSLA